MFKFIQKLVRRQQFTVIPFSQLRSRGMEGLEERRLLSHGGFGGHDGGYGGHNHGDMIAFSLAPAAVQTGLDNLATKAGLTDPTATSTVHLNNVRGVETYRVDITGTGTDTKLTVDQNGNAVTAPTHSTITYRALSGTAAGNTLAAIVTAQGTTAPASTATVNVTTNSDGSILYSINLGTSSSGRRNGNGVTVDANGNVVNGSVPFSVLPTAIQKGLNALAPSGATALASTSTQSVRAATLNGVTTYSTAFTASGTSTTVTVDGTGAAAKLPTSSSTTFDKLPTVVQQELQTLATADGYTGTLTNQTVTAYDEANGTIIYAVTVSATGANSAGTSYTFDVTVASDQLGNPTVPPRRGGFGDGGFGCGGGRGFDSGSTNSNSSGTGTTSNSRRRRH